VPFVVKIPDSMTYEEAAALPLAGSTALQGLQDKGKIKRGDRVLINGASGGVGALAVQIATAHGAEVTGVASGKHQDFVREMGASDFIDYQHQDFAEAGRSWDLIFDAAGLRSYWQVRHALNRGGRYVTTEPDVKSATMTLLSKLSSRHGYAMLVRPNRSDLCELVRLYETGQLRITPADVLPLARAAEAQSRLEAGGHCGKYVLRVVDAK
jgi:NADPH2:quinone reductase